MARLKRLVLLWLVVLVVGLALNAPAKADDMNQTYETGLSLFQAGRYEEALPYFRQSLVLAEARFGSNDPAVSVELNNLAEVLRLLRRYDEARSLYERALALDERQGSDEVAIATSLNNLALLDRAEGRYDEAQARYDRALDLLQKALGPRHPSVAKSLNNLAILYQLRGRPDDALPLIDRAADIALEALGPDDPTTQSLRRNQTMLAQLVTVTTPKPTPPQVETASREVPLAVERLKPFEPVQTSPPPAAPKVPSAAAASVEPAAPRPAPTSGSAGSGGGDAYAIHLASVRGQGAVGAEWQRLAKLYGLPANMDVRPAQRIDVGGKGTFYRVLGGQFASKAEAQDACTSLLPAGTYCEALRAE